VQPCGRWLTVFACLLTLTIGATGFSCETEERKHLSAEDSLDLVVRSSAREAAREAGVDVEALLRRAAADVFRVLPVERRIRVEVKVDPAEVIPTTGVVGEAAGDRVLIALDRPFRPESEVWLPALLAHEVHHAVRFRRRPTTPWTLGDALVNEGLADWFAYEVFPETPPQPWDNALSEEQEASLWRRAAPLLSREEGYDLNAWFYGGGDIPLWAGYTLGYRIVGAYLGDDRLPSEEVVVESSVVVDAYRRTRSLG
jgi:hypothetical protein